MGLGLLAVEMKVVFAFGLLLCCPSVESHHKEKIGCLLCQVNDVLIKLSFTSKEPVLNRIGSSQPHRRPLVEGQHRHLGQIALVPTSEPLVTWSRVLRVAVASQLPANTEFAAVTHEVICLVSGSLRPR